MDYETITKLYQKLKDKLEVIEMALGFIDAMIDINDVADESYLDLLSDDALDDYPGLVELQNMYVNYSEILNFLKGE